MKYNDTNKDNLEMDDMDIKSHLDTSLELSGINVSEDLINRTLEAIKKQSMEQPVDLESKEDTTKVANKVISWNKYIRGFAGVAAAAVIVVAGYGIINNGMNSKGDNYSMDSTTADEGTNAEEATQDLAEENTTFSALESADTNAKMDDTTQDTEKANVDQNTDDTALAEVAPQYSIAAGFLAEEDGAGTSGTTGEAEVPNIVSSSITPSNVAVGATVDDTANGTTSTANAAEQSDAPSVKGFVDEAVLDFRSIFLSEPEKAAYITITDEVNGTTITMTDQLEITNFYRVMDKHQFTYSTESSVEQNYTVEINDPDVDATYVMTVGKFIIISYSDKVVSSQSIYNVLDYDLLTQDLKDLVAKYSK